MKTCSKCKEVKPLLDFGKNKRTKDGLHYYCHACARAARDLWRKDNRDKVNESNRRWRQDNPEKVQAIEATRRAKEKATGTYRNTEWVKRNRDKANELQRRWRNSNTDKANAHDAARRAARVNATPRWLSADQRQQIVAFYAEARRLTQTTGVRWVVDHIVALRGRGVRGLHVPWNLRVITEEENLRKGNR